MRQWARKFKRKFIRDERGAISIYLIIMVLLLFIFNAVLIDYARIYVAEAQVDRAVKAATRSVMSSFDSKIQEKYGLFGFDGKEQEIFEQVFKDNLALSEEDYYKFVNTIAEDTSIEPENNRMVAHEDIITHQILEDMKYRAPIEFTREVLEKFLPTAKGMKEISALTDVLKKIKKKLKNRNVEWGKGYFELGQASKKQAETIPVITGPSKSEFPNVENLADVTKHFRKYKEIMEEEDEDKDKEEGKDDKGKGKEKKEEKEKKEKEKKEAKEYKKQAEKLLKDLKSKVGEIDGHLKKAKEHFKEASKLNKEIKKDLEEAKEKANNDYDDAINNADGDSDTGDIAREIAKMKKEIEDNVIDQKRLDELVELVGKAKDAVKYKAPKKDKSKKDKSPKKGDLATSVDNFANHIEYLDSKFHLGELDFAGDHAKILAAHVEADRYIAEAWLKAKSIKKLYDKVLKVFEDKEYKKHWKEFSKAVKDANKFLSEIWNAKTGLQDEARQYERLKGFVDKYAEYAESTGGGDASDEQPDLSEDESDLAKDQMDIVDNIFKALGDGLVSARDRVYINEYILTHFESKDLDPLKIGNYSLKKKEVEYILYGIHVPGANYGAAIGELFALRFAMNMINALTVDWIKAIPHPLIKFLAMVAYALTETVLDLNKLLVKGKKDFLLKKLRVQFGYKDYLRVFFFLHPRGSQMQRVLAVIEHRSKSDLTKRPTYVKARVKASVDLWFLPHIAEMVSGRVRDGKYEITKESVYSY
ncbi:DUF5702 domain-containing protein [Numidum massiliense]|uniref:DUF5702 domain-containing protein n=1 Tax=Numidum massiliense TaxID=1522315 RepID=UPI0006D554E7|nr:DUF5702 domain-containing protein [Numidum massiliense]